MFKFGLGHRFIIVNVVVSGHASHELQDGFFRSVVKIHHFIRNHESPGVDKRITRDSLFVFQLNQRVKRGSGRFPAHVFPQVSPHVANDHGESKDFRNTLDGKFGLVVSRADDLTVESGYGNPVLVGVDICQGRDVISYFTLSEEGFTSLYMLSITSL